MNKECPCSEDLGAFLLGALDEDSSAEIKAHLETCERCAAHALWLQPAVDTIPESVPRLDPPSELRERVMAVVRSEADTGAEPAEPWWRRPLLRAGGFALRPVAGLAVLAVLVGVGVGYALPGGGSSGGSGLRTVGLATTAPGASADLELGGHSATLEVRHAPPLPRGSVYQVWVRKDGRVLPSSSFVPARDGTGAASVPEALHGASVVMVTRERGPDHTRPTLPVMISGTLN